MHPLQDLWIAMPLRFSSPHTVVALFCLLCLVLGAHHATFRDSSTLGPPLRALRRITQPRSGSSSFVSRQKT